MTTRDSVPTAHEKERATVGACLMDESVLLTIMPHLSPEDMHSTVARTVFESILRVHERGEPVDLITVCDELERTGDLDSVGGYAGVNELVMQTPTTLYAESYANTVATRSTQRRGMKIGERIAQFCYEYDGNTPDEVVSGVMRIVDAFVAENRTTSKGFVDIDELFGVRYDQLEAIASGEEPPPVVPTGFTDLDSLIGGFFPGDLIILAGDTSMGKTSMALACMGNQALAGYNVALSSAEMRGLKVVDRVAAALAGVPQERWRQQNITDAELADFGRARDRITSAPGRFLIDDDSSVTVPDIKARLMKRKMELEHEGRTLDVAYVDYVQLLTPHTRTRGRYEAVGDISHALKRMARDLDIPVVALAQINRSNMGRNSKRPTKHDLRDSGNLEEDADAVILLYREDYYEQKSLGADDSGASRTEVIVDKYRDGATGVVPLQFVRELSTFKDAARHRHVNAPRTARHDMNGNGNERKYEYEEEIPF